MNTASPWDTLLRSSTRSAFDRCADLSVQYPILGKAERVRRLLANRGPMSAAAICIEVEYPNTGLVSASLKHDLAIGRITCTNGLYEINPDYDAELHERIKQAKSLLARHGYSVKRLTS
jgi:hypothetical protein